MANLYSYCEKHGQYLMNADAVCPECSQPTPWDDVTAIKNDSEKCRMDLLDPEWLEEVAWVMTHGANKYSDHNWRIGFKYSRLIGAVLRHLMALAKGENLDPETDRSHAAHLSCCAMFLYWHILHKPDLDDRYKI